MSGRRGGYTLIEVLVTMVLLVVFASILAPLLFTDSSAESLYEGETRLKEITDAIIAFHADVGVWPGRMSDLVTPIAISDSDLCGSLYLGRRTRWAGPYLTQTVPAGGIPAGIGTIQTTFTYMASGTGYGILQITVTEVELNDAVAFNAQIDGDGDPAGGVIRYGAATGGVVSLTWNMAVNVC